MMPSDAAGSPRPGAGGEGRPEALPRPGALPANLARGAIPSLDGIRAVSVAIVFFAHAGLSDSIAGGFGVTIFFFLSGFLITTLFIREWRDTGRIHIGKFYLRRFLRLSPPLFFTLGLGYLLVYIGFAAGEFDTLAVLSQIFYFHNYYLAAVPDAGSVVVGLQPLWSLSVEEHFYLIFPLMFLLFTRGKVGLPHVLGLLVAIVAWRYFRWQVLLANEWAIYISTDTRFDSILFGCLLALLERDGAAGRILPGDTRRLTVVLFGAIAVLALSILARDVTFRSTLRYTVQGAALMVVFHYAVTRPDYWLFRPLNLGWVKTIGLYSYSIYLAHYVIIRVLQKHGWFEGNAALFIAAAALISIAYAAFLWHVVEVVPRRLRHRFA